MAGDDLLHGAGDAAQIGALNVGVDIDHRLDVVMADLALLGSRDDGGKIRQNLHRLGRPGAVVAASDFGRATACQAALRRARRWKCCPRVEYIAAFVAELVIGRLFQLGKVVHAVLRRLDGDVVRNAIAGIEIETGAGLEAAAQRHKQALRHILLRQARAGGARAVYIHREVRDS